MKDKEFLDKVELFLNALEIPVDSQKELLNSFAGYDDKKKLKIIEILVLELEKFKQEKEKKLKTMSDIQKKAESFEGNQEEFLEKIKKEIDFL